MPSPYELKTRWLEWHERWPVPELESLKRQIETMKREIEHREHSVDRSLRGQLGKTDRQRIAREITDLLEVLATLERMMPPF
jgi:hypothetical protein